MLDVYHEARQSRLVVIDARQSRLVVIDARQSRLVGIDACVCTIVNDPIDISI